MTGGSPTGKHAKVRTGLRIVNAVLALALTALKVVSDLRRHRQHQAHSQACGCFMNCVSCMKDGVRGK